MNKRRKEVETEHPPSYSINQINNLRDGGGMCKLQRGERELRQGKSSGGGFHSRR